MKIKNFLFLIVLASTISGHLFAFAEVGYKKLTFDDVFEGQTPLQLCMMSLRGSLQRHIQKLPLYSSDAQEELQSFSSEQFLAGFSGFIIETYNQDQYAQVLSQNGQHLVELLKISNELNLDVHTVYVCLRLFYNKLKETEIIDDSVVLEFLRPLPYLLQRHFTRPKKQRKINIALFTKRIEDVLLTKFTEQLPEFEQQPDVFISQLAQEIAAQMQQELKFTELDAKQRQEQREGQSRLRQLILKMVDLLLSKALWNIKSYEGIWSSFAEIGHTVQLLGVHNIIDHMDDLDDILWTLTHRFCYFLDLFGSMLPLEFYEEMEHDLLNEGHKSLIPFLLIDEQDDGIKAKKEFLLEALARGKAKAIAFEQGIISHTL